MVRIGTSIGERRFYGLTGQLIEVVGRGPGWLRSLTLLSNKVQNPGSNTRKANGFFIPGSHLSEISDYGSYEGVERESRMDQWLYVAVT
jgi:hypothetical protein